MTINTKTKIALTAGALAMNLIGCVVNCVTMYNIGHTAGVAKGIELKSVADEVRKMAESHTETSEIE